VHNRDMGISYAMHGFASLWSMENVAHGFNK